MKLLAIDGNSIINRAFYGIKLLSTKSGLYTNGIYGFMNILGKLCDMESPDGIAVAFDLKAPTFRHKEYAEYKAGRKPMPEELRGQFPLLKRLLTLMGYTCIEKEGFEADDILGTLAHICETTGNTCVIATGDRDSFQLVSDKTHVLLSATKAGRPEITEYTPETIMEKYGITPPQMIDIKALQGDASDNIPGVAGIGEKTAGELIRNYGSIDRIYDELDTLDIRDSLRIKLAAGRDMAFLSRRLGTICRTVPIEADIESYRIGDRNDLELARLLHQLEFFGMLQKLGLENINIEQEPTAAEEFVRKGPDLLLKEYAGGRLDAFAGDGISLAFEGKVCTVCLNDIKNIQGNRLYIYDSKHYYKELLKNGNKPSVVAFDTQLAAYLINPSAKDYAPSHLATEYGVNVAVSDDCTEQEHCAALCHAVNRKLEAQIEQTGQSRLLSDIELPLALVLAKMELAGFSVDKAGIEEYGKALSVRIDELEKAVWQEVGYEFNLNSPKQLGVALFESLGLPCRKKTKSGYSTGAEVLEDLRSIHPAVDHLLQYRTLAKLKSTYCDGLLSQVADDGRIHSTLNQTETRTGRISSSEPNLQNIPVRRPEGREMRKLFRAKAGYVLCDADYSQIELRVLAHIANDSNMINAFKNGIDIHTLTASQVFGVPVEGVTPTMRSRAKAVNFGIVYGIGAFSLAKDIGVTRKEAAAYIDGYLATYPEVDKYMHRVVEQAKEDGFASTMFGRRRLLPELKNSNAMLRAFGERVARNMPIQGTAADIIKIAMIRVNDRLEKELPDARLIMQVHDELIVEAPKDQAEKACRILKEEMEGAVSLSVPLSVDAHFGDTWYDAKG